ncbi:DUF6906 family protein [Paenibacillus radicis (ex Xue et al. 2023)]|uniref:DUF6906 domain-containing protein n=1 Tax=Paenibacillus radicis (ex Xue et al. 2023) TaxID=2972489 RepID=A0ABT1YJW1_9BACL|nr:hypothetical protein [Paenibacillus radicis (ex Xue et al. 2023)]MCR8633457.1 hypothetical protein [Paenibacillus radicis (ex Xue et al. 2023)]
MKNGKRLTVKQKEIMHKNQIDSSMWLVSKVLSDRLLVIHRHTEEEKEAFYKVPGI